MFAYTPSAFCGRGIFVMIKIQEMRNEMGMAKMHIYHDVSIYFSKSGCILIDVEK